MNLIEKEILIESLYHQTWKLYNESIIQGMISKVSCTLPSLEIVCIGKKTAGFYRPVWARPDGTIIRAGMVQINAAYYNGGHTRDLEVTIAHELAHHIAHCIWPNAKQWHGPEFRFVMSAIGMDGNTYHSMSVGKAKMVAMKSKDELFDF